MVSEFSTKAVQRTQVATSVLSADTDALTGESKEMQSAQQKLISLENTRAAAWADKSSAALAETKQMSSESHNGAKSTLVNVVGTSQDVNTELNSGNDQVLALKDKYSTATAEALKQSAAYLATRTKELNNQASATDGAVSNSADILKKTMQSQHDELEKKHDGLKKDIQGASADLKKGADKAVDDTTEAEADSVSYVMQEIERDTGIAPAKKSYTYPDEFVETDPYVSSRRFVRCRERS